MDNLCLSGATANREGDGYEELLACIRRSFNRAVRDNDTPLFTTDVSDLYDLLLENIPADARQHYNCNACRHFVNKYGRLVTISPKTGKQIAVMWGSTVPEFFHPAVKAIKDIVESARITGIFITDEETLGYTKTGVWTHMAVEMPQKMVYRGRVNTAAQKRAEKDEDRRLLLNSITKYKQSEVESAVNLLRSDALFQAEKILPMAEWFLEVMKAAAGKKLNGNIIWQRAATAPAGFCHIPANMLGTLLDDIREGYNVDSIKARFNEKMHPLQYQRPQAPPAAGNVQRAEEIIAKLGMENSLKRRYARLDEVTALWKLKNEAKTAAGGVFAGVPIKGARRDVQNGVEAPETAITFEKFRRTVLPTAKKMELQVSYHNENYGAVVTAVDPEAPPIILWDMENERNPFSWYVYNGGSAPGHWGLSSGFTEVTAVVLQPNMWSSTHPKLYPGEGAMFVLKGARDTRNPSACLFPAVLKGELREVRATIETFSRQSTLSGSEEGDVCGLLIQSGGKWLDVHLRVTTDVGIALYKIDRWD